MEWEQDISMFDWFFTPNNTSSKVIAITIGTIKYCYNISFISRHLINCRFIKFHSRIECLQSVNSIYENKRQINLNWAANWKFHSILVSLYLFAGYSLHSFLKLGQQSNFDFSLISCLIPLAEVYFMISAIEFSISLSFRFI